MRYGASFLAYAIWVHKNAMPKNWLMWLKGLICRVIIKQDEHIAIELKSDNYCHENLLKDIIMLITGHLSLNNIYV